MRSDPRRAVMQGHRRSQRLIVSEASADCVRDDTGAVNRRCERRGIPVPTPLAASAAASAHRRETLPRLAPQVSASLNELLKVATGGGNDASGATIALNAALGAAGVGYYFYRKGQSAA